LGRGRRRRRGRVAVVRGAVGGEVRREAVVIGAGVSGLCSAVRLAEDGWDVLVVAADPPTASTSDGCGGYWFPYKSFPAEKTEVWARKTREAFERMASESFVRMLRSRHYVCGGGSTDGVDPSAGDGARPGWAPADWREMGAEEGYEVPESYPAISGGVEFSGPVVEMPMFLSWLTSELARLGGKVVTGRRLSRMEEAAEHFRIGGPGAGRRVVVNCAGMGNRMGLARDRRLVAARGQVLYVDAPGLADVVNVTARHADGSESFCYAIPRGDLVVLGGTYELGEEQALHTVPEVERGIWKTCADLLPPGSLDGAKVLGSWAGLRPVREAGVRLQVEDVPADLQSRGVAGVVSNYGHGGSGVTLCWGCADDVLRLANSLVA